MVLLNEPARYAFSREGVVAPDFREKAARIAMANGREHAD
jgi:hypothetical protein